MTITYSDPWKDSKFAKLKGDKRDTYFKVIFDEARFYKHEDSYVLAGFFTLFMGVNRAYGSGAIEPILCELPVYGKEYEVRQKKEGTGINGTKAEYETKILQPSIAEKLLYQHIEDNPATYLVEEKAIKGDITFYPDDNYIAMANDEARLEHIISNCNLELIDKSGKYPDWTPPKPYSKSSYSNSKVSPEEKLTFLKKQLAEACKDTQIQQNKNLPLHGYIEILLNDYADNERFLVSYFDFVKALVN